MSMCDTKLRELRRQLGAQYTIRTIDLERCLYRDFGNGFNVEISNVRTTSMKKLATLYLWFGEELIVKTVRNVAREDIGIVVEELYEYTKQLVRDGLDNWSALLRIKCPPKKYHIF